jgi:hypothetical protein
MGQLAHQVKAFIAQVLMEFPELMGSPDVRKLLQNRELPDPGTHRPPNRFICWGNPLSQVECRIRSLPVL